ncbi:TlpA family protein disulfide reductase, partial [Chryseobacterium sp.]|uniref:TlpA family protein disulfide reductase n=1 Tax=Chryseobacterium sp. TaxID=1871047 RepID=UPI0011C98059
DRKKSDLTFVDENGRNISLSEMKGKVVFINFWATWCRPCVEEMPTIAVLKNQFKGNDKIVFILLNVEADLGKSKKFMADRKLDLPVYLSGGTIPSDLFQGAIPTTLIFNKNGDLEANIQGARNFANPEIYKVLNELTKN